MSDSRNFLGKGWAFPFNFDANKGGVKTTADRQDGSTSDDGQKRHLVGAVRQILETSIGERLMQCDFGTKIMDLVFEPMDESLSGLLSYYAAAGISRWDKRVVSKYVEGMPDEVKGLFRLLIRYEIANTNISGNMVFPFYTRGVIA
jgi:hypothetical protein